MDIHELESFLYDRMRQIRYDTQEEVNTPLDLSYIETKGFKKSDVKHRWWGDGYKFSKGNDHQCNIYFKGKGKRERKVINIEINGISSSGFEGMIGMLYCCMDEYATLLTLTNPS